MRFLYHCLGAVAKANSTLWRYRINFIPLNVVGIFVLGTIGLVSWDSAAEALRNSEIALQVSFKQLHDQEIVQNYVKVSGLFIPSALYEYTSNGTIEKSWAPMVDLERKRVILVQRSGRIADGEPQVVTLSGMLRPVGDDLLKRIAEDKNQVESIPIETKYMLVDGESPTNARVAVIGAVLTFFVLGCVALVILMRNTVFQTSGRMTVMSSTSDPNLPARVRATGRFVLDANTARRFVSMPALLTMVDGFPVLLSNIDASSRFMGIRTKERAGIWSIAMKPGTLRDAELGFLYFGFSRQPALRLSYSDSENAIRRAVISVDDASTLGSVATVLAYAGLYPAT